MPTAREVRKYGGSLVVRVGRYVQHRSQFVELVQRLFDFGRAGKTTLCRKGSQRCEKRRTQKESTSEITQVFTF
jgi:hypothetical protein